MKGFLPRHFDLTRRRDRMPGVEWLKITDLHMVGIVQTGCCHVMHRAHRFHRDGCFYELLSANHSKMDLSIDGHRFFKGRSPIDVPIDEDCAWITCDGEQKWLSIQTLWGDEIMDIRG